MSRVEKKQIGSEAQHLFQISALEDNYIYLLTWNSSALVVDPAESKPILSLLDQENATLKNILITHYHDDHTAGNEALKKKTGCRIIGPEDDRVPGLDRSVAEGEELIVGPFSIEVLSTPGHTKPHVVYFFRDLHLLFSGDLLFAGGCGRLFEGSAQEMWSSLEKVMQLPDDTEIFCGHEYTVKNLGFAQHLEPNNPDIATRLEKARALRNADKPTIPSTIAEEKKTNPFLRAGDSKFKEAVGMPDSDPVEVFASIRELKDNF